jgi:hypothetical protein
MAKSLVNVTLAEVFDIQRTQLAPGFIPYIRFEDRVDFTEIFKFETHSLRILSISETIFFVKPQQQKMLFIAGFGSNSPHTLHILK